MHPEILTDTQQELLPLIKEFKRQFILVGGTAIALYLGHRRSIDFDLFSKRPLNPDLIYDKIYSKKFKVQEKFIEREQNHTMIIKGVQFTFFHYPFPLKSATDFKGWLRVPSLLDLAAMKVHALGGRGKWKDYVDLYFLFRDHFNLKQISDRAVAMFGGEFNPKLLRQQLCYFEDINYTQRVEFLVSPVSEAVVKKFLTEIALS